MAAITDTPVQHFEGSAECAWRNVRITPELMNALVEAARGRGFVVDWREPDADGFYTPQVTHADGTPKGWSGPY